MERTASNGIRGAKMKKVIFNMTDLSDSREVMMKKTPFAISGFIFFVAIFTVVALVFASFGEIENYVVAAGEIRPENEGLPIIPLVSGNAAQVFFNSGDTVKEGDVLIILENEQYFLEEKLLEAEISSNIEEIDNYKKLIEAIENDINPFEEENDPMFYYYYKEYETELKTSLEQMEESQKQNNASIAELELSISSTESKIKKAKEEYNDFLYLYNCVKDNKDYKSKNQNLTLSFNNYKLSSEKAEIVYLSAKLRYDSIKKQYEEDESETSFYIIEEAFLTMKASKTDWELVKSNFASQLNDALISAEANIADLEQQLKLYNSQRELLENAQNPSSVSERIKRTYLLKLNEALQTLNEKSLSLTKQSEEIKNNIDKAKITASSDGVIMYFEENMLGKSLSAGTEIGIISPNTEKYTAEIYIPEYEIPNFSVGKKIEYIFPSLSANQYEKIHGEITYISADSFENQSNGIKYYKAKSTLPQTVLIDKSGNKKDLQIGMSVEIHTITEKETILNWLLNKLNII